MSPLSRDLRGVLESTVRKARAAAEAGARKALESHAIEHREPWESMTREQRELRIKLRAHGRHLGDQRDSQTKEQAISRLVEECAYSHWHRMLFARFLAESHLLIEPDTGVPITLAETKEFAREQGCDWLGLASDWAGCMLPQIFRAGDPVLEIVLPPETRAKLEALLADLPQEIFLANDSLGWVYQFWQADRKDQVNRSGVKIGADELPTVTQLFTEDYMVLFLLHNTLGAWWAGKVLSARPHLAISAENEDELRAACRVNDEGWTYLRFARREGDDDKLGPWRPAAGTFDGWPQAAKDITLLDPCMGSGHFLVFALPILAKLRMAEEGLPLGAAVEAVLRDNLFGLEIDPRCTQIAAFNLAFTAWRMAGFCSLPELSLACSGLAVGVSKTEWLRLAKNVAQATDTDAAHDPLGIEEITLKTDDQTRVENGLAALYDLFAKLPVLGSLIDPRGAGGDLLTADFETLKQLLEKILAVSESDETAEMAVAARGMAKAAELLGMCFTLVLTNVPFLGRGKQNRILRDHLETNYGNAKRDLATAMLRRCLDLVDPKGTVAAVTPQNWLFLVSYKMLREQLLREVTLNTVAALGPRAFETVNLWDMYTALVVFTATLPVSNAVFSGFDVNESADRPATARKLSRGALALPAQERQCTNPDSRISINEGASGPLLQKYASAFQGISPADLPKFGRQFWEGFDTEKFRFWGSTTKETHPFKGKSLVLRIDDLFQEAVIKKRAFVRGELSWGKFGISVSQMGNLPASLSLGEAFDTNAAVIVPNDPSDLLAIWAFCSSPEYNDAVRKIDRKLNVTNATLVKIPFDLDHWRQVAAERYPEGLPKPHSDDPTQWLFDGHPARANAPLQVVVARLVGYRWPRQSGSSFLDCPSVGLDGLDHHVDEDGIVCLSAIAGETPARERLLALLADAFGTTWSAARLADLLAASGFAGKSLDDWLHDGFFAEHCKLFHHRPFVWHVWDGRRDGFHALVNYHRLAAPGGEGRRTLEKLIYSFLGAWIDRKQAEVDDKLVGAEARLIHAEHLRDKLIKIYNGDPPYDLFVRWKPLKKQPVGWDPDINDGVRINIRPFMTARPHDAKAKNACILRTTPNVNWKKDRGTELMREKEAYPWFWSYDPKDPAHKVDFSGGSAFDGNRWNDLHYTRACKEAARARAEGSDES